MTGAGLMLPLKEYFESKGGRIYLEHKVTSVIKDANGRVIGVEVLSPDGKILKVRATKGWFRWRRLQRKRADAHAL